MYALNPHIRNKVIEIKLYRLSREISPIDSTNETDNIDYSILKPFVPYKKTRENRSNWSLGTQFLIPYQRKRYCT